MLVQEWKGQGSEGGLQLEGCGEWALCEGALLQTPPMPVCPSQLYRWEGTLGPPAYTGRHQYKFQWLDAGSHSNQWAWGTTLPYQSSCGGGATFLWVGPQLPRMQQ